MGSRYAPRFRQSGASQLKPIGLISGSFNPIHNGHIALAHYGLDQLGLSEVLILIDANPPGKPDVIDFGHRLAMAKIAARTIRGVSADKLPLQRQPINHTIESARSLRDSLPDTELVLLMGADTFMTLNRWSNREDLFTLLSFGVAGRNGSSEANAKKLKGIRYSAIDMPEYNVSSTGIREAIGSGQIPEGLHDEVYDYIKQNKLYRNTSGSH